MNDRKQLETLYCDMYAAMIAKDATELDRVLDDDFVLVHMTGMRQGKRAFLRAVCDGTLNYYSAVHESIVVTLDKDGETARLIGRSRVSAAVFGGGTHTWRLQQTMEAKKTADGWRFTHSAASTY